MNADRKTVTNKAVSSGEESIRISMLVNSISYFLETVFILAKDGVFRLVVIHNGRILTDKAYGSARGAKIAFSRRYSDKAWNDAIEAFWSEFYDPGTKWFKKKNYHI
jgi:hypothetical protein